MPRLNGREEIPEVHLIRALVHSTRDESLNDLSEGQDALVSRVFGGLTLTEHSESFPSAGIFKWSSKFILFVQKVSDFVPEVLISLLWSRCLLTWFEVLLLGLLSILSVGFLHHRVGQIGSLSCGFCLLIFFDVGFI